MKYEKILSALSICPSEFNESEEFYRSRFEKFICEYDYSFREELRDEIRTALFDSSWSWKDAANSTDFYAFDPDSSESEHLKQIRYVMWDVLFVYPDVVAS